MPERNEQGLARRRTQLKSPTDAARDVHPAFERFLQAVDAEVESRLTADEVESRLQRTLGTFTSAAVQGWPGEAVTPDFGSRARWAAYGYHVVQLWLLAIATAGRPSAQLHRTDIDELAVETAARAVNSFRDQAQPPDHIPEPEAAVLELKVAFLTECVRHLPYAYRSRQLMSGRVPFDEFEDADEVDLVHVLWVCVTAGQAATLSRVGRHQDGAGQTEEIITLTPVAIRTAAQRYPDAVDPSSMS